MRTRGRAEARGAVQVAGPGVPPELCGPTGRACEAASGVEGQVRAPPTSSGRGWLSDSRLAWCGHWCTRPPLYRDSSSSPSDHLCTATRHRALPHPHQLTQQRRVSSWPTSHSSSSHSHCVPSNKPSHGLGPVPRHWAPLLRRQLPRASISSSLPLASASLTLTISHSHSSTATRL